MTLRVVLDTNVLLSGLLWHGEPHTLIERVREGTLILVSSPALLTELAEVIARPQFATILARSNTSPERSLAELRALAEVSEPEGVVAHVADIGDSRRSIERHFDLLDATGPVAHVLGTAS